MKNKTLEEIKTIVSEKNSRDLERTRENIERLSSRKNEALDESERDRLTSLIELQENYLIDLSNIDIDARTQEIFDRSESTRQINN
jgi:hypothetical protein